MISNKLKSLMQYAGKKEVELASLYGIKSQSMNNKFSRGSFSAEDLIRICDFCGATLTCTMPDGHTITLDTSDIRS